MKGKEGQGDRRTKDEFLLLRTCARTVAWQSTRVAVADYMLTQTNPTHATTALICLSGHQAGTQAGREGGRQASKHYVYRLF